MCVHACLSVCLCTVVRSVVCEDVMFDAVLCCAEGGGVLDGGKCACMHVCLFVYVLWCVV